MKTRVPKLHILLLLFLVFGAALPARAAEKFCSDAPYNGVIDGEVHPVPTQITIDTDCTFQNFPESNPLTTTVNFQTNDPTIYLIIFNNVVFTGHMACASVDHRIWFSNGSDYGSSNSCQDLFIPVESIEKESPSTTASVGVPFTYTLTLPSMSEVGGPSANDLHTVTLWDDLSATGADLTYVDDKAYYKGSGETVNLVRETDPNAPGGTWTPKNLSYEPIPLIETGEQIVVEFTVVLDDTANNAAGTTFTNTAKWQFGRLIEGVFYEPLPGEWGVSEPMTIAEPQLVMTKSGSETALNLGVSATFTLDVQNVGGGIAHNAVILDQLPDGADAGMCDFDPAPTVSARIVEADGTAVADLVEGTDYSVTYSDCQLGLSMLSDKASVASDQRLLVSYQSRLDDDTTADGQPLTNVAGATEWDSGSGGGRSYTRTLTDGTPGTLDHQDSYTVTTDLSGYYFQKTVENLTSGENPAATAAPGDRLRYRVRLFNVDQTIEGITITDPLDLNSFDPSTFAMGSLPAGAAYRFDSATGLLEVTGDTEPLNVAAGEEIVVEFEATLVPVIRSGTTVLNRAQLSADALASTTSNETSTLIGSAPALEVWKTSEDITGDPAELMAGDTLRYTLTVENTGNENAVDAVLRDDIPDNTSYVAGSTTLNGAAVADPSPGVSPLADGMAVNTPADRTAGYLPAGGGDIATVTIDVAIDPSVMDGVLIENQGFLAASGEGSGPLPETPSDDPATPTLLDPTRDVVGNLPVLRAQKTVEIQDDYASPGIVDPGDVLHYTIAIDNFGNADATNAVFTDPVPKNTSYVADSLRLNGASVGPDGGVSPLESGLAVHSADQPGSGIVSVGAEAVVTFDVRVDDGVASGTLISNQGAVASSEVPDEPTDADGDPANGYQSTDVVVGEVQMLSITKDVSVVGGGEAEAGDRLEYRVRATNIGSITAANVVMTDDLAPLAGQASYIAGSGLLNGSASGVGYDGSILSADYSAVYGDLQPGDTAELRFRVQLDPSLSLGTTVTNTGTVQWNDPAQTASASVSLDLGGTPGSAALNGTVWQDVDFDAVGDDDEPRLEGWTVELYGGGALLSSATTDSDGTYRLSGLLPNHDIGETYELRFRAPGAGPDTASLGTASSPFTDGPQRIADVIVSSGDNLQGLDLPITPNGVIYDSLKRLPVAGARLRMLNVATDAPLPGICFEDPVQQGQATAAGGYYKFDLNFSDASCQAGGTYYIEVTPPASGYSPEPSRILPYNGEALDPFSVPDCPGSPDDAVPATTDFCEVSASADAPQLFATASVAGTSSAAYHLFLTFSDGTMPGHSQVFNNHIPVDPVLDGAVSISKTSPVVNASKAELVPYTIAVENVFGSPLEDIAVVDRFPAGFKYVEGSARMNGASSEPTVDGRQLLWDGLSLGVNERRTFKLLLAVGAGVAEGEYVNRARVISNASGGAASGEATATVRVVGDPTFDCTDVIGKVFDDRNLNGRQDEGEPGLAGSRVATARGLIATTDEHGRFHISCATIPDGDRGSNFILKLDDRSLPTGYRVVTENPRVQRATRGKMMKFNFGATVHRVVGIDISDGVFEPDTTRLRLQWTDKFDKLMEVLRESPAVLRLSYLADVEDRGLVRKRIGALKEEIIERWNSDGADYRLTIETEVFWRRGGPM